jgi:hypothetical protein
VGATGWTILIVIVVFAMLLLMGRWLYRSRRRVPGEPEVVPQPLREASGLSNPAPEPADAERS